MAKESIRAATPTPGQSVHPLHDHIAQNVADYLRNRRVVVWYDQTGAYLPFINEVRGAPPTSPLPAATLETVMLTDRTGVALAATLCCYGGSYVAVRMAVEPEVAASRPDPLLIYLPGVTYDERNSLLLELEYAGHRYQPLLKRDAARPVLGRFYSDGFIDDLYLRRELAYGEIKDLITQAADGGRRASLLHLVIPHAQDNAALIAAWLADPALDADLVERGATHELYLLCNSRLGLRLDPTFALAEARTRALRYLLINEFRLDCQAAPPAALATVPAPTTAEQRELLRKVLIHLRQHHPAAYITYADTIEAETGLAQAGIDGAALGATDTFRFEERALLHHADTLLAQGAYTTGHALYQERRSNFWVDRDPLRLAQWELCRLIADLGRACDRVAAALPHIGPTPAAWISAYAADNGWYLLDQAQRRLESWLVTLDEEPEVAAALSAVRQHYERLIQQLAVGFTQTLQRAQWQVAGVRQQSHIYADLVKPRPNTPVAYFLVDALRYEMGQELAQQLAPLGEVSATPAVAALPSITKVGMAALLPGAATSFNLADDNGKLAARIADSPLADWPARRKHLAAHVPGMVEFDLDRLIQFSPRQLTQEIAGAGLIVIRSQEIDTLGESGSTLLARRLMESSIGAVARGVRKLHQAGIAHFVISADHGHLFAAARGDDMKLANPGGTCVELHRRCWIGHGGAAPAGAVRISGAALGYATDLDLIFPEGVGVFRAGGDLVYHHGGLSLQEIVVPVLQVRIPKVTPAAAAVPIMLTDAPKVITTRSLGAKLRLENTLFSEARRVRPLLMAGDKIVGVAGMAINGDFDPATQCVILPAQSESTSVGFRLTDESATRLRIVILDPITDALLVQSDEIEVKLGL
jgi:hypothetical protein